MLLISRQRSCSRCGSCPRGSVLASQAHLRARTCHKAVGPSMIANAAVEPKTIAFRTLFRLNDYTALLYTSCLLVRIFSKAHSPEFTTGTRGQDGYFFVEIRKKLSNF
jgi:hypothetical protein